MTPADLLFNAFSNLTGGIIADLTTAMIAMIMLGMIIIGFKLLQRVLLGKRLDDAIDRRDLGEKYERYKDRQIIKAKFRHDRSSFGDF